MDATSVELPANYNVAPTQGVAAVLEEDGQRRLEVLRWGLIPPWADDPQIGSRMINARSEMAPEKQSFRRAFRKRRCLIPADGFYEWRRTNGAKQPYYIHLEDGRPFTFIGLWESWSGEGEVRTCTILTTGANALVGEIHDRMPVILARDAYDVWLDPASEKDELRDLLAPFPEDGMEAYPVSRFVNNPQNNDPRCVEPAA